jgi:hypothetical protein
MLSIYQKDNYLSRGTSKSKLVLFSPGSMVNVMPLVEALLYLTGTQDRAGGQASREAVRSCRLRWGNICRR